MCISLSATCTPTCALQNVHAWALIDGATVLAVHTDSVGTGWCETKGSCIGEEAKLCWEIPGPSLATGEACTCTPIVLSLRVDWGQDEKSPTATWEKNIGENSSGERTFGKPILKPVFTSIKECEWYSVAWICEQSLSGYVGGGTASVEVVPMY